MLLLPSPKKAEIQSGTKHYGYISTNAGELTAERLAPFGKDVLPAIVIDYYYAAISFSGNLHIPELPSELAEKKVNADGFLLTADNSAAYIVSPHPRGVLYGLQALEEIILSEGSFSGEVLDYPDTAFRAFHMDLRYGFPSFQRMLGIIDELSNGRFNYFLLEYENRFPYETFSDITDSIHYTKEQIKELQSYAAKRYIEMIPLQQTIGHLEYLLKLPKYNHLREMRKFPETGEDFSSNPVGFKHFNEIDEICASNEAAYEVVETMLSEIIEVHKDCRYVHIGCDEAWNLLSCDRCVEKYGKDGANKLYAAHINRMCKKIFDAGKTPIIWDDMLRHFTDEELKSLDSRIVIMIWLYYDTNYAQAKTLVKRFRSFGFTVLGAAASKCGEGPELQYLDVPWYDLRLRNVNMWSRVCEEDKLDGFCMTVWSNYSGTIAPPHPFFDTIWYPVMYAAEKMWNSNAVREAFEPRYISAFFGTKLSKSPFFGRTEAKTEAIEALCKTCTKHAYEAQTLRVMNLVSIYRLKAAAIGRELYRLNANVTNAEKTIVRNRALEVVSMRKMLKPLVAEVVGKYFTKQDVEVFLNSRFEADEFLFDSYLKE